MVPLFVTLSRNLHDFSTTSVGPTELVVEKSTPSETRYKTKEPLVTLTLTLTLP